MLSCYAGVTQYALSSAQPLGDSLSAKPLALYQYRKHYLVGEIALEQNNRNFSEGQSADDTRRWLEPWTVRSADVKDIVGVAYHPTNSFETIVPRTPPDAAFQIIASRFT